MRLRAGRAVATGHTRDDRVETILYRLAASPGSAAFAALPAADGGGRVRPLLELGREEVRAALRASGHRLARRLLERRSQLRAQPRAARPAAGLPLAASGGRGEPAAHCRACWPRTRPRSTRSRRTCSTVRGGLSTAAVADAPGAVLRRALRRVSGFPAPRPAAAERVGALARSRSGAGSVPLGAGRVAERRYERIVIVREAPAPRPASTRSRSPCPVTRRTARPSCAARSRPATHALDAALAPALVLRAPRPGERLPGARRTIARMLLEARVPRSERARYPVVAVHGEPVALPGIAVAAALRRPTGLVLTIAAS